jgi:hypothetical protein
MFVHGSTEAGFIHVQVLFAGDVAGDLEGQTVGGIQVESLVAVEDRSALRSTAFALRLAQGDALFS